MMMMMMMMMMTTTTMVMVVMTTKTMTWCHSDDECLDEEDDDDEDAFGDDSDLLRRLSGMEIFPLSGGSVLVEAEEMRMVSMQITPLKSLRSSREWVNEVHSFKKKGELRNQFIHLSWNVIY